jgi:TldD protein
MNRNELPPELRAANEHLPALVLEMEKRVPYAAASLSRNGGLNIRVSHREQQVTEVKPSQGLVLSAWNGSFFEERASSELTPKAMFDLAQFARTVELSTSPQRGRDAVATSPQRGRDAVATPSETIDPGASLRQHSDTPFVQDPTLLSAKDKLELCLQLHGNVRDLDPHIVNVQVHYSEVQESKAFANRSRQLSQNVLRLRFTVVVLVSDGQQVQYDWLTKEGTGGLELVQFTDEELRRLCDRAVALLTAEKVPPGMYEVICSPDVSGVIAHEAFGHGVELDMFLKGRARSQQYLGKPVASPLVSIVDDPSYPGAHGSYFFDDEGQLASPTYIIREGVFEQGLSDLLSAHRLHMPHTANGRRESFERKIYVRMSNTFFARGETPVSTMIESVERGVYLNKTSSGMEDPKGWGMQVTSHYGQEIRHGKLTGRLFAPVGITGYVPDILQSVSAVGNDFALSGGTCGKGHKEWVPVSSGGPHLRLKARLG